MQYLILTYFGFLGDDELSAFDGLLEDDVPAVFEVDILLGT